MPPNSTRVFILYKLAHAIEKWQSSPANNIIGNWVGQVDLAMAAADRIAASARAAVESLTAPARRPIYF